MGALALLMVAVAGVAVDTVFGRLQNDQLQTLLSSDVERVAQLVQSGTLGERLLPSSGGLTRVQFVAADERVQLPDPSEPALPLQQAPSRAVIDGVPMLVTSLPWVLPSGATIGTIRGALDLREAASSRTQLRVSLLAVGAMAALLSTLVALVVLRRGLAPLRTLALQAAGVDPGDPRLSSYEGPDDEVGQVADALHGSLATIRQRQRAERDALAEIAHELAGPLTVVAGELNALARRDPEDRRLETARAAAAELVHASHDLRTLARGELERRQELSVIDVGEIARVVAGEYAGVVCRIDDGDLRVVAERDRVRQMIRNLLRNAVQACGDAARVELRARVLDHRVLIEVIDDGPGLSPEAMGRVFERYVSGRAGGSGIGLAVVRRLAQEYGGRVGVRSDRHQTEFLVELPAFEAQVDQ